MIFKKKKSIIHPDTSKLEEKIKHLIDLNTVKDQLIIGKDKQIQDLRDALILERDAKDDWL